MLQRRHRHNKNPNHLWWLVTWHVSKYKVHVHQWQELPPVSLAWHVNKYNVRKLHQDVMYILAQFMYLVFARMPRVKGGNSGFCSRLCDIFGVLINSLICDSAVVFWVSFSFTCKPSTGDVSVLQNDVTHKPSTHDVSHAWTSDVIITTDDVSHQPNKRRKQFLFFF